MPSVVSRWHGDPFQKSLRERKIALETAFGALDPSSRTTTSPHVVFSVRFHALPAARLFEGALFHDCGVAGALTVGVGQGFAASEAPADAEGVGVDVAAGAAEAAVPELVRLSSAAP